MQTERFTRTEMVLGRDNMERLYRAKVAVFGLGGVGGYAAEALARAGIGRLDLIDHDTISVSNINRQILALDSTVGTYKVDAAAERIARINPDCKVRALKIFYLPDTEQYIDMGEYDYVLDAIDTVTGKLLIIENARKAGVPVISAMGTGNKLDPTRFRVADLADTKICPLARIMRKELKKRGIEHVKVVYSEEMPRKPLHTAETDQSMGAQAAVNEAEDCEKTVEAMVQSAKTRSGDPDVEGSFARMEQERQAFVCDGTACGSCGGCTDRKKDVPGSLSFVPGAAGLIMAGEVIKDICGIEY